MEHSNAMQWNYGTGVKSRYKLRKICNGLDHVPGTGFA
jgi:hypothetical protein